MHLLDSDPGSAAIGEEVDAGGVGPPLADGRARYRLIAEIGRGGMGVVHRAHDRLLGRDVAVKRLHPGASTEEKERLLREARIAAGLDLPGVVRVYELWTDEDTPCFSMELVEGVSLDRLLPLAPARALAVARAVAFTLAEVHAAGVIHRDVKPSNILVRADGTPVVTDLGVARRMAWVDGLTGTGQLVGTMRYMAPEQLCGGSATLDARTDVYALGVTLFELLTGRLPFEAGEGASFVRRVLDGERLALGDVDRDLGPELEAVVSRCLEPDASDRYATMAELGRDLERCLEGAAPSAGGRLGRLGRVLGRRRRAAAFFGAAVVAILVAVAVARPGRAPEVIADRSPERIGADVDAADGWPLDRAAERRALLERALDEVSRALGHGQATSAHHRLRARILARLRRGTEAEHAYDLARALDRNDAGLVVERALLLVRGLLEEASSPRLDAHVARAVDEAEAALAAPGSPSLRQHGHTLAAARHLFRGDTSAVVAAVERAPPGERTADALALSAVALYSAWTTAREPRDGRLLADAVDHLASAAALDPWSVVPRMWLAEIEVRRGRLPEALREADALVVVGPGFWFGPWVRGVALFSLGRLAEARASFEHMPDDAVRQHELALVELRTAQPAAALARLDAVLAGGDASASTRMLGAAALVAVGERAPAAPERRRLFERAAAEVADLCRSDASMLDAEAVLDHPAFGTSLLGWASARVVLEGRDFEPLRRDPELFTPIEKACRR
jgi:tetratricopeptide (TPR) repeat protein